MLDGMFSFGAQHKHTSANAHTHKHSIFGAKCYFLLHSHVSSLTSSLFWLAQALFLLFVFNVISHLWEDFKECAAGMLDGMFSFVLLDTNTH